MYTETELGEHIELDEHAAAMYRSQQHTKDEPELETRKYKFVLAQSTSDIYDALSNPQTEITYVQGQRGNRKILCNGSTYICTKTRNGRKYWVCSRQRSRNCTARLITDDNETYFIERSSVHNHK